MVSVSLLARADKPFLAAMLIMFPTNTLICFLFLHSDNSASTIHKIALGGLYSLPTLIAFFGIFLLAQPRLGFLPGLLLSMTAWAGAATLLVVLNERLLHI